MSLTLRKSQLAHKTMLWTPLTALVVVSLIIQAAYAQPLVELHKAMHPFFRIVSGTLLTAVISTEASYVGVALFATMKRQFTA